MLLFDFLYHMDDGALDHVRAITMAGIMVIINATAPSSPSPCYQFSIPTVLMEGPMLGSLAYTFHPDSLI